MPTTCPVRCPLPHLWGSASAAGYTYIDALNGRTVTRQTHLSYTLKSQFVNILIRGFVWKTGVLYPSLGSSVRRGMASAFSHAAAALSIGVCFYRPGVPRRVWVAGALCSMVPDLDVLGFRFGIRYGDFWGHRGFTHSLIFAAIAAGTAILLGFRLGLPGFSRLSLWLYFFVATASHGLLDAMTDGGLGVAFISPFDNRRYFLPWRPVHVAPIGIGRFFSARGADVLKSEFVWIWIPAALLALCVWRLRVNVLRRGGA